MIRMDRLATLDLFVSIVERGSFSAAAAQRGVSRPVATSAIKALEQRLGTRLLQRSTRHVQPTVEGEAYYRRCVAILADLEDADQGANGAVTGLVRIDVAGHLARAVLHHGGEAGNKGYRAPMPTAILRQASLRSWWRERPGLTPRLALGSNLTR